MTSGTRTILIGAAVIVIATVAAFFIRPTISHLPATETGESATPAPQNQ